MSPLQEHFSEFFLELNGKAPFPWQKRLAEQVCTRGWPKAITLPTGSGKTACLDIAVFALAFGRGKASPRRIFYIVDRRLVVNDAFKRMRHICSEIATAQSPALSAARTNLQEGNKDRSPLQAFELRGGTYRDNSWVRDLFQPLLIAGTVDQIGSRLLFRAYGVPDRAAPLHAALTAFDSLILLDEAHASRALSQTLETAESYARLGADGSGLPTPFRFVEMTATPQRELEPGEAFSLDEDDRKNETLQTRLRAPKPVQLVGSKARPGEFDRLAEQLVTTARALAQEAGAGRVAILCNRVRTALAVHEQLEADGEKSVLLTGRMRPLDRDDLYEQLAHLKTGVKRQTQERPLYVAATQTLEVGADLDFDVMVSEAASLDALLQRFGRLNRAGEFDAARGAIVAGPMHLNLKKPDPVYGNSMPLTWEWLQGLAANGNVSMSLENAAGSAVPQKATGVDIEKRGKMTRRGPDAPILLPAHLDALAQTNPRPAPEPDVALFLHGTEPTSAEVQVVLRADLTKENHDSWLRLVEFCPPLPAEALPARLWEVREWLAGEATTAEEDADVEGVAEAERGVAPPGTPLACVLWRNGKASVYESGLRPGDTIVAPATTLLPPALGYIPPRAELDMGDRAQWKKQGRVTLRLHPAIIRTWAQGAFRDTLLAAAEKQDMEAAQELLSSAEPSPPEGWLSELIEARQSLRVGRWQAYPAGEKGLLFEARVSRGRSSSSGPLTLKRHLGDVVAAARANTEGHLPPDLAEAISEAAARHDWGKAEPRFQALLRGGDGLAGRFSPVLLAKSTNGRGDAERAGLPKRFRHELLSLLLAEKELGAEAHERDLILHLIASHHGYCRPLAPVIADPQPCTVSLNGLGGGVSVTAEEIQDRPGHHISHGVADRFWNLTRRHGWWGLAYLEAALRLADWKASANADSEADDE